jgi:hypothetical protein
MKEPRSRSIWYEIEFTAPYRWDDCVIRTNGGKPFTPKALRRAVASLGRKWATEIKVTECVTERHVVLTGRRVKLK